MDSSECGDSKGSADDAARYRRAWRRMNVLSVLLLFVGLTVFIISSNAVTSGRDIKLDLFDAASPIGFILSVAIFTSRCPRCRHLFFIGPHWNFSWSHFRCMHCNLKRGSKPLKHGDTREEFWGDNT